MRTNPNIHPFTSIVIALIFFLMVSMITGCGTTSLFSQPQIGPGGIVSTQGQVTSHNVAGVVQKQVWLLWIAGLLCLAGAGLFAYIGQYIPALKFGLAGLILPIVGTWWSEHYAIVIAVTLIGVAIWYVLTHTAARSAISAEMSNIVSTVKKTPL